MQKESFKIGIESFTKDNVLSAHHHIQINGAMWNIKMSTYGSNAQWSNISRLWKAFQKASMMTLTDSMTILASATMQSALFTISLRDSTTEEAGWTPLLEFLPLCGSSSWIYNWIAKCTCSSTTQLPTASVPPNATISTCTFSILAWT